MHYKAVSELPFVENYVHFDIIDSTNTYAKQHAPLPQKGVTIITAARQSAGRGRLDRKFHSSSENGLWASILARVENLTDAHFGLNRALSLAICGAVERIVPLCRPLIKWPNDIYIGDRKLCGILLESVARDSRYVVAGFGINVNTAIHEFTPEIAALATSVFIETGNRYDIDSLCTDILGQFQENMRLDAATAHQRYRRILYGIGKRVGALGREGVYMDVDEDGRLRMLCEGEPVRIASGALEFIDKPERHGHE